MAIKWRVLAQHRIAANSRASTPALTLGAVVGVKAPYEEGEGLEESLEEREQEVFRDALEAAEERELGDLVDQVDV